MSESESDQRHDLGLTIAQDVYLFVHCIDASLVSLSMYIMGVGLCTCICDCVCACVFLLECVE